MKLKSIDYFIKYWTERKIEIDRKRVSKIVLLFTFIFIEVIFLIYVDEKLITVLW